MDGLLISVRGVDVILTPRTIELTKKHFIDNSYTMIEDAILGEVFVNDLPDYILWCKSHIEQTRVETKYSFTFIQRAYWIQTGECVPLLG